MGSQNARSGEILIGTAQSTVRTLVFIRVGDDSYNSTAGFVKRLICVC